MPLISVTLIIFQLDILSGKDNKEEQLKNIKLSFLTLEIFHFEISDKFFNDVQPPKHRSNL